MARRAFRSSLAALVCLVAAAGAAPAQTDTWHNVYEPNTSNNNFKFNTDWPGVDTILWTNGNQHVDLNISQVRIRELVGSFGGKVFAHLVPWFDGNHPASHHLPGYHSPDGSMRASPAARRRISTSGNLDPSLGTFDLGQCPVPPGTYDIYVQAVGQPFIKNLLSAVPSPVTFSTLAARISSSADRD